MKNIIFFLVAFIFVACQGQKPDSLGNVSVEQFRTDYNKSKDIVIDVRTPEEWANGVLENALLVNFYDENFESQLLKLDKANSYYVYCKSGGRSAKTLKKMSDLGFTNVSNILGGAMKMKETGIELTKP